MNVVSLIPAQYAKAIASLVGNLLIYLQLYGATWHLVPAVTAIAVSLGVAGVPNAPKPPTPAATALVAAALRSANAVSQNIQGQVPQSVRPPVQPPAS